MAEWLSCSARTPKVLCSNLGATCHGVTLGKLLTAIASDHPSDSTLLRCDIHQLLGASMWLVSVYGELKQLGEKNSELDWPSVQSYSLLR